jgi:hypothetical protein
MRTRLAVLLVSLASLAPAALRAQDPPAVLPPPHALTPLVMVPAVTGFERPNPYDVWKFYAVDRRGYFRPRVVLDPVMPYYLATGEPYPLLNVKPHVFMPYIME